ncbi:DUF177 domain-containing protein [Luteolibacter flavescens]|uniref:DUF177 domain-containing protein n=1 Tax=Luteolibacter flavescens TaxID=1859460 RepID=A0ABT3FNE7_9BACT|nr:DUF177 domain-containing protein [Luteolibacter flavescens]MCW1884515.1 DUF177 domain-containing protein [Luteolibacter flavescens]
MSDRLLIDLPTLPEEGKNFSGELPPEVFDLPEHDAKPLGPFSYDLYVQRFGSELLLSGTLSAPFEFICVRTIHPFTQTITVENANVSVEIESEGILDATEAIREEVLLAFPDYPRCDEADDPQHCEIDSRYLAVDKPADVGVETRPRAQGDDRWAALDALDNLDSER